MTMKKKAPKYKMLGPTLHLLELIPVTDPVKFAEMDRRSRAALKAQAEAERKATKRKSSKK